MHHRMLPASRPGRGQGRSQSKGRSRGRSRSPRRAAIAALLAPVLVAAGLAAVTGAIPGLPGTTTARADVVTASQDNLRDGWDQAEPGLAPASDGGPVGGPTFGRLFATQLNGQVYAQPVVAGHTVIVATETNHVYGLNAATGAIEWSDVLGPALPSSTLSCDDLTPSIGVTSTPVYDPGTGTAYLVAVVNDGPRATQPHVYVYALSAQTGHIQPGWPVPIRGSAVNNPTVPFNPLTERQRTGLLLMNGSLYMGFASYCDYQPWVGYIAGVSTSTRATTLWSDEAGVTDSGSGIWQAGGGLMSDRAGRIFVATGNGVSPPPGPGTSPPAALGDSVVRLSVAGDGTMSAADFFSPANAPTLDAKDIDLGSGGPVGLPFGTGAFPHLLVQAGKDGRVFVLNRDWMGGREQGAGGTDSALAVAGPYQGQWGHPATFGPQQSIPASTSASGDYFYYVGRNDVLRYLEVGADSAGHPTVSNVATSTNTFGYSSGSPVVTSNGTDPASAVVWEVDAPSGSGAGASLDAYPAVPPSSCSGTPCSISPIWTAPIGTAAKFTIPVTDSGRVYVGTRDGVVYGFGSPDAAPLTGSPVSFGKVTASSAGGAGKTLTATLTAAAAVTVTGASVVTAASGHPFQAGTPTVNGTPANWPVSLSHGDKLRVPVTFAPAGPGGVTGSLQLATDAANFPAVSVSLSGTGTAPGFYATPASYAFGNVPAGTDGSASITITNGSTGAEKIARLAAPAAPFTAKLPARGRVLVAGQSVTVPVAFAPAQAGARSSSFTITAGNGHHVTVKLTGTGIAAVTKFTAAPASVSFGNVPLGQRATQTIDITNNGNLPATITAADQPRIPFAAQADVATGLPVNPGDDIEVPVTFTPTSTGPATGSYTLRWHDAGGSHAMTVKMTGYGASPTSGRAIAGPGGGWMLNGAAALTGTALKLVPSGKNKAGSAVYAMPAPATSLSASFTTRLAGQGGMTLSLLSPGSSSPASLGAGGGQLGFGGLHGVAVVLDGGKFPGQNSANFVGIATGSSGGRLKFAATTSNAPDLRHGSHAIGVTVSGRQVKVTVDGKAVLSARLAAGAIPSPALVAFTGGSGRFGGSQQVTGVTITPGTAALPAPGGGWSYNGAARGSRSSVTLTPAVRNAAGSVVLSQPVQTSGLTVTFTAQLSGGTGAEGLALALLDPASAHATSLGKPGAGAGLSGLTGTGVTLTTLKDGPFAWANSVSLCTGTGAGLKRLTEAHGIPPLRSGPQTVTVSVAGHIVTVWLDGVQVIQRAVPALTPAAVLAFTGSTGALTDVHLVRDVAISAAS